MAISVSVQSFTEPRHYRPGFCQLFKDTVVVTFWFNESSKSVINPFINSGTLNDYILYERKTGKI